MKNVINYYYNLEPIAIHQINKKYYFKASDEQYVFITYDNINEIDALYDFSNSLLLRGLMCHQMILNIDKQILTKVNEDLYVLMKIYVAKKDIAINDILNFNNITINDTKSILRRDDWFNLWTNKIDYFEYQINQLGKKHPIITRSFSYYVGLAENAISLISNVNKDGLSLNLSHRRILYNDTFYNLYNPLNFVIDLRVRDICEYFKSCFFNGQEVLELIKQYLSYNKLSYNESCYFFARLLYPSYYFDVYEKIIDNQIDEEEINYVISKVDSYENILREVYIYLKSSINIPEIEWLQKAILY
ncbi:MAG: hypothetical protein RSB71_02865 [Bacilli bacterium]